MAYTTQQLIANAFYLSQIVARGLETVSGEQIQDGLFRLNGFLSAKGGQTKLIPYYDVTEGNFTANVGEYFIPNLVEVDSLAFFIDDAGSNPTVRYSMQEVSREQFFGDSRVENIKTLPYQFRVERVRNGSNIYVYYLPDKDYPYVLTGKYALQNVELNQDLEQLFDNWYLEYLLYGLADYLCDFYSVITPPNVEMRYKELEAFMTTLSPMDFTLRSQNFFSGTKGLNYADANLGKGWRP